MCRDRNAVESELVGPRTLLECCGVQRFRRSLFFLVLASRSAARGRSSLLQSVAVAHASRRVRAVAAVALLTAKVTGNPLDFRALGTAPPPQTRSRKSVDLRMGTAVRRGTILDGSEESRRSKRFLRTGRSRAKHPARDGGAKSCGLKASVFTPPWRSTCHSPWQSGCFYGRSSHPPTRPA